MIIDKFKKDSVARVEKIRTGGWERLVVLKVAFMHAGLIANILRSIASLVSKRGNARRRPQPSAKSPRLSWGAT